jgi:hypothetical protein
MVQHGGWAVRQHGGIVRAALERQLGCRASTGQGKEAAKSKTKSQGGIKTALLSGCIWVASRQQGSVLGGDSVTMGNDPREG